MTKDPNKKLLEGIRINRYIVHAALLIIFSGAIHTIFKLYLKPTPDEYMEVISDFRIVCLGWIPVATVIMILYATQHIEFLALLGKDKFREYKKIAAGSGIISIFMVIVSYAYEILHDMLSIELQNWLVPPIPQ